MKGVVFCGGPLRSAARPPRASFADTGRCLLWHVASKGCQILSVKRHIFCQNMHVPPPCHPARRLRTRGVACEVLVRSHEERRWLFEEPTQYRKSPTLLQYTKISLNLAPGSLRSILPRAELQLIPLHHSPFTPDPASRLRTRGVAWRGMWGFMFCHCRFGGTTLVGRVVF